MTLPIALVGALLAAPLHAADTAPAGLPNPFYAIYTAFDRPGLTLDQQFDLVKQFGFAGIAWTETAPEQAKATAEQLAKRGLKMHAIYCAASVTPEGDLKHSPNLTELMAVLKGARNDRLAAHRRPGAGVREAARALSTTAWCCAS